MKILVTFTILIITGISSSTTAFRKVSPALPKHLEIFGLVNTTIEDIEEFDRALCEKNGGPTTYNDHKKSLGRFESCGASFKRETYQELMMAYPSIQQNGAVHFFQEFCHRILNFGICIKNLTDSMKTCLDVEKHESANIIYNVYISLIEFVCDANSTVFVNNRTGFSNLVNIFHCVETPRLALAQCVNQTFIKYVQATVSNGATIGGLGALHLLVPDVNKCTVLQKFQLCTVKVMANCTTSTSAAEVANSLFNIVKKVTTCDHLLKSDASPSRVANIVLITAATAMSFGLIYKIMENFQHCSVNALKNCTQTETADLINSLFNIVKRETTCEHLLKSGSLPLPIVNIVLMTVATAISLRSVHG